MTDPVSCPACGAAETRVLYRQASIPAQSVVLLDNAAAARAFPSGAMTLAVCEECGFLFNADFDATLIDYAAATEESQHFSGTFNNFARDLISEIAGMCSLENKLVLEVGCGKGDFLEELVRRTGCRAIGIDPGYRSDRRSGAAPVGDILFRREYFDPTRVSEKPDMVVCRHTLEHIPDVLAFMSDVVSIVPDGPSPSVMFETPDVERVLAEGAFWDIYHEHCSYFTTGSHARLFRRVGLEVTASALGFGEQYIIQYARRGKGSPLPEERELEKVLALCEAFPAKTAETCAYWNDCIAEANRLGHRVAIWGGGSKCVAFLAALHPEVHVDAIVDINTYKQGKYLPGTAHEVISPEALGSDPPEVVIAMNPTYSEEIGEMLRRLDLHPRLLAV